MVAESTDRNWRTGHMPHGERITLWGQPVEQILTALPAFDRLFAAFQPKRIIEWGTGTGGFAVYLAVWARLLQAELLTVDHMNISGARGVLDRLPGLPVRWRAGDFLADPWLYGAGWTIPRAPSLWLCDGGTDKADQLRLAAGFLRSGDVAMVHDYAPSGDECGKMNQVDLVSVTATSVQYGLQPFMQDVFDGWHTHWLCLRKR